MRSATSLAVVVVLTALGAGSIGGVIGAILTAPAAHASARADKLIQASELGLSCRYTPPHP